MGGCPKVKETRAITSTNSTHRVGETRSNTSRNSTHRGIFLTQDHENMYYKVPVPHGVELRQGTVSNVCNSTHMKPVCHNRSDFRVHSCVDTEQRGDQHVSDIA